MLMILVEIKPKGRMTIRPGDFHRCDIADMLLFEKTIEDFQEQSLRSMRGVGEFRVGS